MFPLHLLYSCNLLKPMMDCRIVTGIVCSCLFPVYKNHFDLTIYRKFSDFAFSFFKHFRDNVNAILLVLFKFCIKDSKALYKVDYAHFHIDLTYYIL